MRSVEAAGARVSVIGLGTWQFGSSEWGYGEGYATSTAPALVARALELGVSLFDTAEAYAFGRSERILGQALGSRRSEAFVATKLFPVLPISPIVQRRAHASAKRLGTDVLDLYQVHWHNPAVPASLTAAGLRELLDEGLARHVGVSNYSLAQWRQLETALRHPVLSNQVPYNLIDRLPEQELLPWSSANDRLVIAYSPLAQGLLSGRYGVDRPATGSRAGTPAFLPENLRRVQPLLGALEDVARTHGCSMSQVALAWVVRRPNVVAIPGASSIEQLEANVAAADLELTDDEDASLVAASEAYRPLTGASMIAAMSKVRMQHVARRLDRIRQGLRA